MHELISSWKRVFSFHYLFYLALHFLLGVAYCLEDSFLYFVIALLLFPLFFYLRGLIGLLFFSLGFLLTTAQCREFPYNEKIKGHAHFCIENIQRASHPILPLWQIKGKISYFRTRDYEEDRTFPLSFITKKKSDWEMGHLYEADVEIEKSSSYKLRCSSPPTQVKDLGLLQRSLIWRTQKKEALKKIIRDHFSQNHVRTLLTGLTTGVIEDPLLTFYFQKLGLQHLLAISGFHFGIVILFFHFFLGRFISPLYKNCLLALILTSYFFYLGPSPSVFRAFIASLFGVMADFFRARIKSLDVLGFSLILDLCMNPLNLYMPGFSLSYAATFGILTLYQPLSKKLSSFLKGPSFFISLLSLYFAATFTTIPIVLSIFHTLPFLSLIYNLIIPFWITLIMFIFIGWLPFMMVPYLGPFIAKGLELFTNLLIKVLFYYPRPLDFSLTCPPFPTPLLVVILIISLGFSMFVLEKSLHIDKIYGSYGECSSVG